MQPLDKSGEINFKQPKEELSNEEGAIQEIPFEVLEIILGSGDPEASVVVSKQFANASIGGAKKQEAALVNQFVDFITNNLNPETYSTQIAQLRSIMANQQILGSVNLMQVKESLLGIKDQLLNVLGNLKKEDVDRLKEEFADGTLPKAFEDIFLLAQVFANKGQHNLPEENWTAIFKHTEQLVKRGKEDEAIGKSTYITDEDARGELLTQIIDKNKEKDVNFHIRLINKGIEKATENINKMLPDDLPEDQKIDIFKQSIGPIISEYVEELINQEAYQTAAEVESHFKKELE